MPNYIRNGGRGGDVGLLGDRVFLNRFDENDD